MSPPKAAPPRKAGKKAGELSLLLESNAGDLLSLCFGAADA